MSNDLIELGNMGIVPKFDDEVFDKVAGGDSFLPRLQLLTSNSAKCKDGSFPTNHYAFIKNQVYQDIGDAVDVLVLAWRPKAMDMSSDDVLVVYDYTNPEFARISAASDEKDSGCMFGAEFLVFLPSVGKFASFFMGSKSARRESANVKALVGKAATFKSKKIDGKKYVWFAPIAVPCSTPFDLPPIEEIKEVVQRFLNPPITEVERIQDSGEERAR